MPVVASAMKARAIPSTTSPVVRLSSLPYANQAIAAKTNCAARNAFPAVDMPSKSPPIADGQDFSSGRSRRYRSNSLRSFSPSFSMPGLRVRGECDKAHGGKRWLPTHSRELPQARMAKALRPRVAPRHILAETAAPSASLTFSMVSVGSARMHESSYRLHICRARGSGPATHHFAYHTYSIRRSQGEFPGSLPFCARSLSIVVASATCEWPHARVTAPPSRTAANAICAGGNEHLLYTCADRDSCLPDMTGSAADAA